MSQNSREGLIGAADEARERGEYQKALDLYAFAFEHQKNRRREWYIWQQAGVCRARLGQHVLALSYYDIALSQLNNIEARDEARKQEIELRVARVLRDRVDSMVALGRLDSASRELAVSTGIFSAFGSRSDMVSNDHFMGRLERKRGNFKREGRYLNLAYRDIRNGFGQGDKLYLFLDYASWHVRKGNVKEARKLAIEALGIALRKRSVPHVVRALKLIIGAKRPERIKTALYGRR